MQTNINYEQFFNKYHKGDIIYPNAVSRYFGIDMKKAYDLCEKYKSAKQLRTIYMIGCPMCLHTLNTKYYSIESIDFNLECGCTHCDTEFIPNLDKDVFVYYEKVD